MDGRKALLGSPKGETETSFPASGRRVDDVDSTLSRGFDMGKKTVFGGCSGRRDVERAVLAGEMDLE